VSASPCGECAACRDVDAGRFVDLLELDAASNTGVDNMREILDNARYAPTAGRYKVYLIDEVHMLSKGAFNSMLKTLEEPPAHVKFVLATTDPQKIPVTVLSRCLQLNLTPLPRAMIAERLARILEAEAIACDEPALALVAGAAQGSLRDALSLLDQAIAFGGGEVRETAVRSMLGVVDRGYLYAIVDALMAGDGRALLAEADALAAAGHAFAPALDELASLFHRIAVAQAVPDATLGDDAERVADYASRLSAETVQLDYQIAVQGRADLALAPDEATGFSMTLLRLLAFAPAEQDASPPAPAAREPRVAGRASGGGTARSPATASAMTARSPATVTARSPATAIREDGNAALVGRASSRAQVTPQEPAMQTAASTDPVTPTSGTEPPVTKTGRCPMPDDASEWPPFVASLKLAGMAAQLGAQSEWKSLRGNVLTLAIPASHKHLADRTYADKLKVAIERATGRKLLFAFEIGEGAGSLAAITRRDREQARAESEAAFRSEPFVRDLVTRFGATVRAETIESVANGANRTSTRQETP
jgi:DNA polymerase-3 subunit gamma/tau